MRIESQKPNIVRIACHQEKGDPHYGSCLWAYFDFDLDKYMLNIQSDAGNAAYRWVATPDSESFLRLMSRIDGDYLLYKLFLEEEVDVDATINNVRERLGIGEDEAYRDEYLTEEEREERKYALEELDGTLGEYSKISESAAAHILEDWSCDHSEFEIDDIWECVETDFAAWQKRIVEMFEDHVQPTIRKIVKMAGEALED